MIESYFHDPLDAYSVDVPHGEVLDAQVLQDLATRTKEQKTSRTILKVCTCWKPATCSKGFIKNCIYLLLSRVDIPQSDIY